MMQTRRGTTVLASNLRKQVAVFAPGDIVTSVTCGSIDFIGQVTQVDPKCAKVFVNWGDGTETQHDPEEIQLLAHRGVDLLSKMLVASGTRRGRFAEKLDVPGGDQFVGDPKTHGIDKPRGGGFSIMQDLQKDLAPEIKEEAEAGPKIAPQEPVEVEASSLRSRRALYWGDKGRVYRKTLQEQTQGVCTCPKCKEMMEKQKFTKSEKLLSCPGCGFKIPTSKVVNKKIEIEIEPDGSVEVEVEPVEGSRRGRSAAMEVPTNLNRMTLSEIAALISADWTRVNYGAKPYLDAMFSLDSVKDMYGLDTGSSIVAYFLANANTWRGDVARVVKKELKRRLR